MGAAQSSFQELPNNAYLKRFISQEIITPNDPFWNQFLSFNLKTPSTSADYLKLENAVSSSFQLLLQNNSITGNICALTQVFLSRGTELKASAQLDNRVFLWQCQNALFLLRCIIKLLLECLSEDEAISAIQFSPQAAGEPKQDFTYLIESLCASLIEIIVDVPLSDLSYALHSEATLTLIVLMSSHVYAIGAAPRYIILRMLLNGKPAIHACLLVKTLIKRFIAFDEPPATDGGSIILGIASGLWNVLTLGLSGNEEDDSQSDKTLAFPPLAQRSLLFLLVVSNHHTSSHSAHNPYRMALLHAQNFQDPVETVPTQAVATFKIEYTTLYNRICSHLHSDKVTLLLYILLHKNSDFRTFVLSRSDVETLVLPILRTLYNAFSSTSHHIYMSLIILLMLSEDESFNKTVHDIKLKDINWYTERPIGQISLGGLLILVVIRTIMFNMTKMRDKYLHTNCLAALANMSSQFRSLHPYVCQRVVNLFEILTKRHTKLCNSLRQSGDLTDDAENDITDVMSDVSVLEEIIRMVLEILNSTLTHQLVNNHNLIYTLLYKRHLFQLFSSHPSFQDVTQNIDAILSFLMQKLEKSTNDPSVGDVQDIIRNGVLHLPRETLKKFPELRFKYVEENEPEDFFIPYVWTLVYESIGIYWDTKKISLFDPTQNER